jgi:hypothetical protein
LASPLRRQIVENPTAPATLIAAIWRSFCLEKKIFKNFKSYLTNLCKGNDWKFWSHYFCDKIWYNISTAIHFVLKKPIQYLNCLKHLVICHNFKMTLNFYQIKNKIIQQFWVRTFPNKQLELTQPVRLIIFSSLFALTS